MSTTIDVCHLEGAGARQRRRGNNESGPHRGCPPTLRQLQERQPPPVTAETIDWLLEFCSDDSLDTSQEIVRRTTRLRRVVGRWKPLQRDNPPRLDFRAGHEQYRTRTVDLSTFGSEHWGMDDADVERLEVAVAALNDGDLEPFVGLIDAEMVWTGRSQGWLWWRHTPS